jgi:hypothetical protein
MYTNHAETGSFIISALIWLVGTAISLRFAYVVIKAAVLAALRQHTISRTTGVSVVDSVPSKIADAPETPAGPSA